MISAPLPPDEDRRLAALQRYTVLDTLPEQVYDDLVQIAAQICDTSIAIVSLVDAGRQWFKARVGLDATETGRDVAFCAHAILDRGLFVVPDALLDARFADNPLVVGGPKVRFYAGAPLTTPTGENVGTLCVIDSKARQLTEAQRGALQALARQVVCHLEARLHSAQREHLLHQLLESRERHDLVVTGSRDGVWDRDSARRTAYCSPRALQILDLEQDEVQPGVFDWSDRVHLDDAEGVAATIAAAMRAGQPYEVEFRWRLRGGSYRWLQVRGAAVQLSDGAVVRTAGSVADVTERKEAADALRHMTSLLEVAQEMAMVGAWEIDLRAQTLTWSEEVYRIHETSPADYTPTIESAIAFYTPASTQAVQQAVDEAMTTGKPFDFELEIITAKGRSAWVSALGRAVFEGGQPVRIVGAFQDVSERRRAADELRCAKDAAESASRAKSAFLATMSHEIRTPMNGVLGYASLLGETQLSVGQREHLTVIEQSGRSLLRIIDDILDYAKIEAGRMDLESIEFAPRAQLEEVSRLLEPKVAGKGIQLAVHCDEDVPQLLLGDPGRVQQVLRNLVGNAVKFTASGSVRVTASWRDGHLHIEVIDTGIGMTDKQVAVLFREFSQADSSTRRKFGGTGLGLAICKRLIDLMAGQIGVRSQLGEGSCFWFSMPLRVAAAPGAAAVPGARAASAALRAGAAEPEPFAARPRVLLVEDNVVNRHLALQFLHKLDCDVCIAANGKQALAEFAEQEFSLVLMDCLMPEMDGYDATRAIRAAEAGTGRRVPIVALTANAMAGDRQECVAAGMDDHLAKPFRKADLELVLQRWARRDAPA